MRSRLTVCSMVTLLWLLGPSVAAASLDLGYHGIGLSFGNAPRVIGLRINAVDAEVQRVDGLNLTLWNPRPSPVARLNGAALGLIGPKAGRLQGLALGGLGATATERIRGLAAAGFGVGTQSLQGLALGGLLTDIKGDSWGLLGSAIACRARGRLDGLALGGAFVDAGTVRGASLGTFAAVGRRCEGLALSAGVVGQPEAMEGLGIGGLMVGGGQLHGIALSGGAVVGEQLAGLAIGGFTVLSSGSLHGVALAVGVAGAKDEVLGLAVGGLGAGAQGRVRGLALGGLVAMAPAVTGISAGALNGVIIEDVNLEDFLKIRTVNESTKGLALGLVNYSARLEGVQIGLFNYAGNNPRWARLLPILNLHL